MKKYILGIETSCDETACCILDNNYNIISNIIFSQQNIHSKYFGVVPELASRMHYEKISYVLDKTLERFDIKKLNLIAYTSKPGLKGALLIGKTVAKTLGLIYKIPTIGIDHLWGHIYSVILSYKGNIRFPFISLIISGGHTELSIVYSKTQRKLLGETRDDAVGEAFDKVAKMLSSKSDLFRYPGGPIIEKIAQKGNPFSINFPRPYLSESWDFSFSGLKTSVLYYIEKKCLSFRDIANICASFQESIVDTISYKILLAVKKLNCKRICISGGVARNNYLRNKIFSLAKRYNFEVYFPKEDLTTDNAAMIASAAIHFLNN